MNVESEKNKNLWDEETDVAIVGGGGAGLAAAIESANAQANTIVFEKLATARASSTALSGGVFSFAETDFQDAFPWLDGQSIHSKLSIARFAARDPVIPAAQAVIIGAGLTLCACYGADCGFHNV